jgi:biotin operon repressor
MQPDPAKSCPEAVRPSSGEFDLGTWLGRRQAFGMMAGRASAADAQCLRYIRDRKLYKCKTSSWGEFCARYLGASRAHVDRMIQHLEEFGPEFFNLTQLTRISPETYRAIAPQVTEDGLRLGDEVIALSPENSAKVSAAVARLRKRPSAAASPASKDQFAILEKRFQTLITGLNALIGALDPGQQISLGLLLSVLRDTALAAGAKFF